MTSFSTTIHRLHCESLINLNFDTLMYQNSFVDLANKDSYIRGFVRYKEKLFYRNNGGKYLGKNQKGN